MFGLSDKEYQKIAYKAVKMGRTVENPLPKKDPRKWLQEFRDKQKRIAIREQEDQEREQKERNSLPSHKARRYAWFKAGGKNYTQREWQHLLQKFDNQCLRCHRKPPEVELTADHIKPLARGGKNHIENIQPLCRSCNSAKHTKEIDYR